MKYPPLVAAALGDTHGSAFYRVLLPLVVGDATCALQLRMMQDGTVFFPVPYLNQLKPDAILFHRSHTKEQCDYIKDCADKVNALRVYTTDDWVEKVPIESPHYKTITAETGKEIRRAIKLCDRLIVTNDVLANVYGYKQDVTIIPNYLGHVFWNPIYQGVPRQPRKDDKPRIGWSGAAGHPANLKILREIADILGDSVTWVFLGMTPQGFSFDNAEIRQPVPPRDYPIALWQLDLDLALAPLIDNDFNKAKSNLRILEYGACGYPTIASDVVPYRDSTVDLLPYKAEVWAAKIKDKLADLEKLKAEGEALKNWVWSNYKLEDHLHEYSEVFDPERKGFTSKTEMSLATKLDVIVSVHKNKAMVQRCLDSVFKSKSINKADFEVVVVNNASTESMLVSYLKDLEKNNSITLITKEKDTGYIDAINQGIELHEDRDVITLNSDTIVNGNWIDRMAKLALAGPKIATVTPLSNNATILSYPSPNGSPLKDAMVPIYDNMAKDLDLPFLQAPTCVGFAAYYKRAALNDIGLFDSHGYGRGYGEENDWCMRALKKYWTHTIAHNVYVGHEGSGTFKEETQQLQQVANQTLAARWQSYFQMIEQWNKANPLALVRQTLDVNLIRQLHADAPRTLYITHSLGGGLETYLRSRIEANKNSMVLRCDMEHANYARFEIPGEEYFNLPAIDTRLSSLNYLNKLFQDFNIKDIQVETTFGYEYNFPMWIQNFSKVSGIPYSVVLHDYWSVCPRLRLISPYSYCGQPDEAGCNKCIEENGAVLGQLRIKEWREMYLSFLSQAADVTTPSKDTTDRIKSYYPNLPINTRYHEPDLKINEQQSSVPYQNGQELRVAVLGVLTLDKGSMVVAECAKYCEEHKIPIKFVVFGRLLNNQSGVSLIPPSANLTIQGEYEEKNIFNLLRTANCQLGFIPSLWPETYSYTLSLLFKAGLFPVAFDIGAPAERIAKYSYGKVIPFDKRNDIKEIVETLWELRNIQSEQPAESKKPHLVLVSSTAQPSAK